jgi:NAD-dependent deacetylase
MAEPLEAPLLFLTGAGISAESGIPTFRGPEGYWRVGSENYHPHELATFAAFSAMPEVVWGWYLYRRGVCRTASPNAGHMALVRAEEALGDGFHLITQNVDGLHLRAGSSLERTYAIHGMIDFFRCARECTPAICEIPAELPIDWDKDRVPTGEELARLRCPRCGERGRPHVLFFDEYYDEPRFRFESSQRKALEARALVVVGTAGLTNLPMQVGAIAARRGIPVHVVDLEPNPFVDFARATGGEFLRGRAGEILPGLVERLIA